MAKLILNVLLVIIGAAIVAGQTCTGANTVWQDCGSSCKDYCTKDNPDEICITQCEGGCYCISGYKFKGADADFCVPAEECPTCPVNQEYYICGSYCSEYCNKPSGFCPDVCVEGCFCKEGYVLESETSSVCIPADECPIPAE